MGGYKGTISFYKHIDYDFISPMMTSESNHCENSSDYILLGTSEEVDVAFTMDTRKAEIAALEKKIIEEKAESLVKINRLLGRIQELQCLDYKSDDFYKDIPF
jgi:hypothetical protein